MAVPDDVVAAAKVPHFAPVQPVPLSARETPLLPKSLVTVAVMVWVAPTATDAVVGATVIPITIGVALTVMTVEADLVVSATDVAVAVTVAGVGTAAGAL